MLQILSVSRGSFLELFMSTGFTFNQSLHLRNVSNLRIVLAFQPRTFKVGFSGPKTFRGIRETDPRVGIETGIDQN